MPFRVLSIALVLLVLYSAHSLAADAAYENDLIERVQAAFAPMGATTGDADRVHRVCASPLLLEIRLQWPQLSEATRARIAGVVEFERPLLPEFYDTPDGLFRIHYARTGDHAVNLDFGVGPGNVPNYILNCAEILEYVVAKSIDTIGFRFPVSDAEPRPEEDPRFDVYFLNLQLIYEVDLYGLTIPDTVINNGPGNAWWATSYMELLSDYTTLTGYLNRPFEAMAVTIAHEFHHASQWTYDAYEAEQRSGSQTSFPWWLEASATAMEEVIYDNVNDYYLGSEKGYLKFWFGYPEISLRAFSSSSSVDGLHPYASCIWPIYLAQKHGPVILREIWDECGEVDGFNTFAAYDTVFTRRGTNFREAWSEFLVWNYFTGHRAAAWNYDEADQYPTLTLLDTLSYREYPVADTSKTAEYPKSPDELAAAYMRFESVPSDTPTTFRIVFEPHQNSGFDPNDWMIITAGISGLTEPTIVSHNIFATIEVPNWDTYEEILVIATPFKPQPTQNDFDRRVGFRFEVADTLESGGTVSAIRKISSNPLVLTSSAETLFRVEVSRGSVVPVTLRIFTLDGREVRGGEDDNDEVNQMYVRPGQTNPEMTWDGTTSAGEPVATGIYLALVQIGDFSELIKVAVINQRQ